MPGKRPKPDQSIEEIKGMESPLGDVAITYGGRKVITRKNQALYDAGDPETVRLTNEAYKKAKASKHHSAADGQFLTSRKSKFGVR